jgi:CMP-N-acetylneuraminic acid synthetase
MNVSAVIPIRYADSFGGDGQPRMELAGRQLWEITVDQACRSDKLARVVVAYDDERFLERLAPWGDKVVPCLRPQALSSDDATTMDVLTYVAEWLRENGVGTDYLMLLEISHPLRPKDIIDDMIAGAEGQDVDSLITCHPVHYNFWRRDQTGSMDRISGAGENPDIALYEELTGICSLFRPQCLLTENPFGDQVDIVPIDRFWAAIDVRDQDGCWLAEQYLNRLNISV